MSAGVGERLRAYGHIVITYYKNYSDNKHFDIALKRNDLYEKSKTDGQKYFCMNDSDVLHLDNNLLDMEIFLDKNPDWAGVALASSLKKGIEPRHINLRCCMFRKGIYLDFKPKGKECDCLAITNHLRPRWRFGYLNKLNAIEHRRNK